MGSYLMLVPFGLLVVWSFIAHQSAKRAYEEQVIVALLMKHVELSGLELVNLSGGELRRSSVYALLSDLLERGVVVIHRHDDYCGLKRAYYRLRGGKPVRPRDEAGQSHWPLPEIV